jgi:hypothetical protein
MVMFDDPKYVTIRNARENGILLGYVLLTQHKKRESLRRHRRGNGLFKARPDPQRAWKRRDTIH